MTELAENYLLDLGRELRDQAFEAKRRFHAASNEEERNFESGRYTAYYEVISLMLNQCVAFSVPASTISLEGLDPEIELIG